jgi:hypothetical protein
MLLRSNILLLGIILMYVWLILARLGGETGWPRVVTHVAAWGLAIACAALGWKLRLSTWDWRASDRDADYALRTAAFRGWRCNERIGRGFDDAVEYVTAHVPAGEELFVFPDATIVYGLTRRQSYRGVPFVFDLLQEPPQGVIRDFASAFSPRRRAGSSCTTSARSRSSRSVRC